MPYSDFSKSVKCLDNKRLNKQKVECYQILKALNGETKGWVNHPCTKMWKGYEDALITYSVHVIDECIKRGFNDTCLDKIVAYRKIEPENGIEMPWWLGNEEVHESHRSNLYRKDSIWYDKFDELFRLDLPYCWPTIIDGVKYLKFKQVGSKPKDYELVRLS